MKRYKANCDAGRCVCGQPQLVNYASCKRCLLRMLHFDRHRYGYSDKCLYVAETAYGIKVGQSHVPSQRMWGIKHDMLAGLDGNVKLIKSY